MMRSFDVTLFEVGFQRIVDTLVQNGVDISWGEKERNKALAAWQNWQRLSDVQRTEIARSLLADIEPQLREALAITLDMAAPREVNEVEVTIETNLGESRSYTFGSIAETIEFLDGFDEEAMLNDNNGPSLWPVETEE